MCARLSRWVPDRIVACAEAAKEVHAAIGYDARRMVVIPNGYDISYFSPDSEARKLIRAEWCIPDCVPLLGMVARFDPQKDHGNLINALAILLDRGVNFKVALVGTGLSTENRDL